MIVLATGNFPYKFGFISDNLMFHIRPTMSMGTVSIYLDLILNDEIIDAIELPNPDISIFDEASGNAYQFIVVALISYAESWLSSNHPNCTFKIL